MLQATERQRPLQVEGTAVAEVVDNNNDKHRPHETWGRTPLLAESIASGCVQPRWRAGWAWVRMTPTGLREEATKIWGWRQRVLEGNAKASLHIFLVPMPSVPHGQSYLGLWDSTRKWGWGALPGKLIRFQEDSWPKLSGGGLARIMASSHPGHCHGPSYQPRRLPSVCPGP